MHLPCRIGVAQNERLTAIPARVTEIFTSIAREILRYERTRTTGVKGVGYELERSVSGLNFVSISNDLLAAVRSAEPMLHDIGNADSTFPIAEGKWSRKQILSHLIDSASNNHQRFVRAATQGKLEFPGYEQDKLVSLQNPNLASWELLIELWSAYNRYLAHVLQQIPESLAKTQCSIGGRAAVTLEWLAQDYVEHLKHHLNQILGNRFQTAWSASASL